MENQDKLYNQFKSAAENAETEDFPGMENVWNRVEQKLDTKVLKKETKLWKKLAVAASILLVVSVGYHFWNNEKTTVTPTTEIVITDSITTPIIEENNAIADVEKHPAIKENAEEILKQQTKVTDVIVMNDTVKPKKMAAPMPAAVSEVAVQDVKKEKEEANSYDGYFNAKNYEARSVKNNGYKVMVNTNQQKTKSKKEEPLLVIDDVAEDLQKLGKLNADDVESIVVLAEPLYIINGVEYSEVEVFGPNPTSPYSPLNKQDIETISILQEEKAIEVYGKKGEKGVVIITTKNGKPKLKK
ncbi:hypothetical protein [Flavobacterium macrobrachii]|uniref:TonB-dependent outer membrane receptor, SusC/RagA subfamily, signature region n=1 Tax=Flavobacterium macrobrachii TaxID=591204 RepID=A0ABS2CYW5_9FLAO|nr:hypothetical protein [Flavobacterium macrobrachii]MBM6500116.1 hypothetical protein [Flavobacterium macrobrachii]